MDMKVIKGFIVEPVWRQQSNSGLYTHSTYSNDDELPPQAMPIQGKIVSSPTNSPAKKGDTLYFTWNAIGHNKCISHRREKNLYYLDHSYVAYKNSEGLFALDEFVLLELIVEKEKEEITDSGIIISGFQVQDGKVVDKYLKKALEGIVRYIPEKSPFNVCVGDRVKIEPHTDVECEIDGQHYYRVRFEDILGVVE